MPTLWPHQQAGIAAVLDRQAAGVRRLCLTSPTGGGKSRIIEELIQAWVEMGLRVVLYTNRRMLLDQLAAGLTAADIRFGVRAAGHGRDDAEWVQLASLQTEGKRSVRDKSQDIYPADRVVVDESHSQAGLEAQKILARHWESGAYLLGVTATPIDLAEVYDDLVVAGTTSELRACGALVPAIHFGPDEPDFRAVKNWKPGVDLSENQQRKLFPMGKPLFGRVFEAWKRLNPDARPTILFAPGVNESFWFAEYFYRQGVTTAHIDGEDVWINGKWYTSSRDARQEVMDGSQAGRISVLCNRFVLREGIDAPWLTCGVFATVFGSVQSYVQSGGRLLRAYPGVETVTIQDHGGNWWRHGSLNADRDWSLANSSGRIAAEREDRMRALPPERKPYRCPGCAMILAVRRCPGCGYEAGPGKRPRMVAQTDGTLVPAGDDPFPTRRIASKPDTLALWKRVYYRCYKSGMTFRQAYGLFAHENHYWAPRTLPLMPLRDGDWYMAVRAVPYDRLHGGAGSITTKTKAAT